MYYVLCCQIHPVIRKKFWYDRNGEIIIFKMINLATPFEDSVMYEFLTFLCRTVDKWNTLPAHLFLSFDMGSVKRGVKRHPVGIVKVARAVSVSTLH